MSKAVVVFSGGQDSTTCLAWAQQRFDEVFALSFDYGQRHKQAELEAAHAIAERCGVPHQVADLSAYGALAPSALTKPEINVAADGGLGGLPSTFTPGRNLVFLTVAAAFAIGRGAHDLVTGVCQTDYSGYPDCRRETVDAIELAVQLGTEVNDFTIHTPLMFLTKAESVKLAAELGALPLLGMSHTCYHGARPACGKCPACELRLKGFAEAGIPDPIEYRSADATPA